VSPAARQAQGDGELCPGRFQISAPEQVRGAQTNPHEGLQLLGREQLLGIGSEGVGKRGILPERDGNQLLDQAAEHDEFGCPLRGPRVARMTKIALGGADVADIEVRDR